MGRGTVRSLAEAKEGGGAPAARSSLPLHHPSDGPPPHSLRERGGDTDCYPSADCQHIPPRQRTDFLRFSIKSASPARHSWGLWETQPVPSQGRLARPAIRSGGGSGWSGISLCKQGEPDRDRGPPKGSPAGVEGRGGYPGRSRDRDVARPARRRRCGKARTRPPDASFRKTVCAERSVFVETVFLSAHPGEGPGAPPCLPHPTGNRRRRVVGDW